VYHHSPAKVAGCVTRCPGDAQRLPRGYAWTPYGTQCIQNKSGAWLAVGRESTTDLHAPFGAGAAYPHDLFSTIIETTLLALEYTDTVAINDFLLSGRETNLGFLYLDNNPDLTLVTTNCDVRTALMDQLRRRFGAPEALGPTSKGV